MSNPLLYGQPRTKTTKSDPPSSANLAFTTTLSSLIASRDSNNATSHARPRPSKAPKPDIFSRHNKGAQKRAAADLRDDNDAAATTAVRQTHQRSGDIGAVDAATLYRSKRRMEEKARMYDDMKSGLYLAEDSDEDDDPGPQAQDAYLARLRRKEREGLVDFDRKWADTERAKGSGSGSGSDEDDDEDDGNASIISYEDELGRTRRGTRREAAQAARAKAQQDSAGAETSERWRPARPENLIYGAAVQSEAFNPSANVASQMEYLATRRDRSPTPEETHYDADAEVRNRGTGFYAFSKDEDVRRQQMEELMNAREETQKERDARRERRAARERAKENRKQEVDKLRAKRRAEMFLAGLGDVGVLG
ncbi:hypothetical protein P175DRAFT_0500293 [Aspergillus ochraceoroseus IBT 24754]|uniref:Coiled-coil domain-containing protein n=3 Tax=Aspergillus subgen. Nidulantes TaxID=2720870 RepID=A0A0F8UGQ7_9EURO|nr:uncharacterized protein P175DRAFT_0500293 [Aspergillus ochraceoroseus IBT 24754]KKK12327.1 hypothetical protein AOCH_002817 [Aspergillus ochraceoroseus]KKK18864.1 hypothetical protein ARAM_002739 [Aspergillus rambellii]PTU21391.1 hypothetical protein P175DRAFT_0500293 [Aspergillus ochraceoroseus IBT 24754]